MFSQEEEEAAAPLLLKNNDEDNNNFTKYQLKKEIKSKQNIYIMDISIYPKNLYSIEHIYGEHKFKQTSYQNISFLDRLKIHIELLFKRAKISHELYYCTKIKTENTETYQINPDYLNNITRVLTPEFSMYGAEPLSLEDFSSLFKFIKKLAKKQHENIHMFLSSISVKYLNSILNISLYVQCGKAPRIDIITKSCGVGGDIVYPEFTNFSQRDANELEENNIHISDIPLSNFIANDDPKFPGIIPCNGIVPIKTLGDAEGIVTIEMCAEHAGYKALKQLPIFIKDNPDSNHNVQHILSSASFLGLSTNCSADSFTQIDPVVSREATIEGKINIIYDVFNTHYNTENMSYDQKLCMS